MSSKFSSDGLPRVLEAAVFAAEKHRSCRRKDADATPYINHPLRVAQILIDSGVDEVDVIISALLHDTVEDTGTTNEELAERFGPTIASLVAEVTDDKTLARQVRKDRQVESAPFKSDRAKLGYRACASRVAKGCRGVIVTLDQRVSELCSAKAEGQAG
jgi:(p)ppGpp synthase/HD superfamily hydrolase